MNQAFVVSCPQCFEQPTKPHLRTDRILATRQRALAATLRLADRETKSGADRDWRVSRHGHWRNNGLHEIWRWLCLKIGKHIENRPQLNDSSDISMVHLSHERGNLMVFIFIDGFPPRQGNGERPHPQAWHCSMLAMSMDWENLRWKS